MSDFVGQRRPKYTYFDFKAGKCSDLEYFRSAYGGKVTKHYAFRDTEHAHPFFLVNRRVDEGRYHYFELKVYDLKRGLIDKKVREHAVTNNFYWNGDDENAGFCDSAYFREYVQYLIDTLDIPTSDKSE